MRLAGVLAVAVGAVALARAPHAAAERPRRAAVVLVLDLSRSMVGDRLSATKRAAIKTVAALGAGDELAIVGFDAEARTLVALGRVTAKSRRRVYTSILRAEAIGGTNVHAGLRAGFDAIRRSRLAARHVVLLSDGASAYDGIPELVTEMRSAGVTVSAIGLGEADRNLLSIIADRGDGRLYLVEDSAAALSELFVDELVAARR